MSKSLSKQASVFSMLLAEASAMLPALRGNPSEICKTSVENLAHGVRAASE